MDADWLHGTLGTLLVLAIARNLALAARCRRLEEAAVRAWREMAAGRQAQKRDTHTGAK